MLILETNWLISCKCKDYLQKGENTVLSTINADQSYLLLKYAAKVTCY